MVEVFRHLDPVDLLHLSWASKDFHALLMARSSAFIWKTAFANVPGMPSLPPDMNEAQYARLAFVPLCSLCCKATVRKIDWPLRCRICSSCAEAELEETEDDMSEVPHRPHIKNNGINVYVESAYDDYRAALDGLPTDEDKKAFRSQRKQDVKIILEHASLCEKWSESRSLDRTAELREIRKQRYKDVIARLTDLGWGDEIKVLYPADLLWQDSRVKQNRKLTDRAWNNIRDPLVRMMEKARDERLARDRKSLLSKRRLVAGQALNRWKVDFLAKQGKLLLLPEVADFVCFEEVHSIIKAPVSQEITIESFAPVLEVMSDIIPRWRQSITKQLMKKVYSIIYETEYSSLSREGKLEALDMTLKECKLAKTVFKCPCCEPDEAENPNFFLFAAMAAMLGAYNAGATDEFFVTQAPLFYPAVLGHECLRRSPESWWDMTMHHRIEEYRWTKIAPERHWDESDDDFDPYDDEWMCRVTWTPEDLELDRTAGRLVTRLLEQCGLDPDTTTAEEMDKLDYLFSCGKCDKVMGWKMTIAHQRKHAGSEIKWTRLDDEEAERYRRAERHVDKELAEWKCVHCIDLPTEVCQQELPCIRQHLHGSHSIRAPIEGRDYFRVRSPPYRHPVAYTSDGMHVEKTRAGVFVEEECSDEE
ncbi:hypothetical protein PUNSTDRAFT_143553 [Punctularia strigosozonata HHB-11173 SS5]|uniref:uncharacterized protein n=1 Tax=Punctularia strigosozonata (strain HHB-11173) TaxID=741275 RepID=UPI0004418508|nr:uncharacterized protein PUNSTDRAFT_143553 [Punctularia strigosozonata HHB-11173 SS5]EIN08850.1 hypothetical protein PUNSTDRAFT_143553 [Punctularia strigosozonata HHB-11173 SS5]